MRDVRSMNAVRCQHVLAVPCTDGGLGLGLQKSLYPYPIYTLQFDKACSHGLINGIMLEPAAMNALLSVALLLYSKYTNIKR